MIQLSMIRCANIVRDHGIDHLVQTTGEGERVLQHNLLIKQGRLKTILNQLKQYAQLNVACASEAEPSLRHTRDEISNIQFILDELPPREELRRNLSRTEILRRWKQIEQSENPRHAEGP